MINMVSIASVALNLTPNQMKEKNTDMNTNMKCLSKLLKPTDISIENVEVQNIYKVIISFCYFSCNNGWNWSKDLNKQRILHKL